MSKNQNVFNRILNSAIQEAQRILETKRGEERIEYLLDMFNNNPELLIWLNIKELLISRFEEFTLDQRKKAVGLYYHLVPTDKEAIGWYSKFIFSKLDKQRKE